MVKIRLSLDNLIRNPGEPISSTLLKIDSLYSALYGMSMPHKTDKEVLDLVLRHKVFLIGAFISTDALKMLMSYSKERASKGKSLTLEEIVTFINRLEQNVPNSRLNATVGMPKGGSSLDSIQSSNTTLNGFNNIDCHTLTGVFTSSFTSHHNNRRQQYNNVSTKRGNFYQGRNSTSFNKTRVANNYTRAVNGSNFIRRPSGAFHQTRPQINMTQGYRRPARRGFYPNNQSRGFYRNRDQGQRKEGQPKYDRSRSPRPRYGRAPERNYSNKSREEKALPRSRSNSRGRSRIACLRCNGSHLASKCPIYRTYSDTSCRLCNLLHPTKDCKQSESKVHTGEVIIDEVVDPELVEGEQEELVEGIPDEGLEQEQEFFQSNEEYDGQWDNYPEDNWEVNEEGNEDLSPFFLF